MRKADVAGLIAGYALDAVAGDPRRFHPVAGYGSFAAAVEKRVYGPSHRRGTLFTAIAVGVPVAGAFMAQRLARRPAARFALITAATWAVLGGRSLRREGRLLASSLEAGEVAAARERLPNLCGRDPSALDGPELARAALESVAENTSDAVVAPLVWGGAFGLPGLVFYRAANTLDAMVGHRSARYERFGTASARLDDAANLVPSRLTALLAGVFAPAVGGSVRRAWSAWRAYGDRHPSPNSGQCEASFAGALDVRLGGTNVYFGRSETRPTLGFPSSRRPLAGDVRRAAVLSGLVGLGALAVAVALRSVRRG
jgi:adenosylcobinamide-phosphate synthase